MITSHHFCDGLYAKRTELKAGEAPTQHKHEYSHVSALAKGRVVVTTEYGGNEYMAPAYISIRANLMHKVEALEDSVWFCIHITDETDADKIDGVLIAK
jgi:quercetin dioxygenase-like cupin family protein